MSLEMLTKSLVDRILGCTQDGRYVVVGHSFSRANPHHLTLMTTSRRRFPDVITRFRDNYPAVRLDFGHYVPEEMVNKFFEPHPDVYIHADDCTEFDSTVLEHRLLLAQLLSQISPCHWYARGFALLDICGFSSESTPKQVSHRLVLDGALLHARTCLIKNKANPDLAIEFNRISTGDGYYFWHRRPGPIYDLVTFALLVIAVAYVRGHYHSDGDMEVRAAFGIGEAYTLPYVGVWDPPSPDSRLQDAVGPALNSLARLLVPAAPSQLLVGDFHVKPEDVPSSFHDPASLLGSVSTLFTDPTAVGLKLAPAQRHRVTDKHGDVYYCYNVAGHAFYYPGPDRRKQDIGLIPDETEELDAGMFRTSS